MKHTVDNFLREVQEDTAWGMVGFMFNHKYADQGDFDTMNETLRRCAEHVDNEDGWDDDDDGDMIYWTAAGRKKLNLKELVQLMFDAEVLDYFAKSYIGTKQAYNDGFY